MNRPDLLRGLGYSEAWVNAGVVDEEYLKTQWRIYCDSDDKNEEHYRCGAVRDYLRRKTEWSSAEIEDYLKLEDNGPDECDLKVNRAIELIVNGRLDDEQLRSLTNHPVFQEDPAKNILTRECVGRSVARYGLRDNDRIIIKKSNDGPLHELLLNSDDASLDDLLWLFQHGRNKSIRARAEVRHGREIKKRNQTM